MKKHTLALSVFTLNFANELIIMGLIVWASLLSTKAIEQTALVVAVMVFSIVAGVLIKQKVKNFDQRFNLALALISSFGLLLAPKLSLLWYLAVVFRTLSGQLILAHIMALLKDTVSSDDLAAASKTMQIAYTSAGGVAYGLAPIIVTQFVDIGLHYVDVCAIITTIVLTFGILKKVENNSEQIKSKSEFGGFGSLLKNIRFLTPFLFLVWTAYGVFFVVEVPLLQNKIQASAAMVSLFLLTNIFSNIVATKILPEKFFSEHASLCFTISAVFICGFSALYLSATSLPIMFVVAVLLGIVNGGLNLSLNTQIHKIENIDRRESSFLWYRITIETGILGGAVICYLFAQSSDIYTTLAYSSLTIAATLFVLFLLSKGKVLESELSN